LLTFEESALLIRRFDEGLSGYTYLEGESPSPLGNGHNGRSDSTVLPRPDALAHPPIEDARGEPAPGVARGTAPAEKRPLSRG
jgi:hypothetical protein